MKVSEIVPISQQALQRLFRMRGLAADPSGLGRRRAPRWPFPGAVEIWVPAADGGEEHRFGTCENISMGGAGVRCDDAYERGTELQVAVHQPELSLHGRAVVRHCTRLRSDYYVGLEFIFDD